MQVWNVLHMARWKYRTQKVAKNRDLGTIAQLCRAVSSQLRHISTIGKKLLKQQNTSSTCPGNMVNLDPLTAEMCWQVWGTPANFNGFWVLAALLHGTVVVVVSQTLRRWTEGATFIRQGGHHVGHWPTFLVSQYISLEFLCKCSTLPGLITLQILSSSNDKKPTRVSSSLKNLRARKCFIKHLNRKYSLHVPTLWSVGRTVHLLKLAFQNCSREFRCQVNWHIVVQ